MRFRLMYLFSFILSAAAMWFFRDYEWAMLLISGMSGILINLGIVLSLCFIALTVMGSGASLRRTRKLGLTIGKTFGWMLIAAILALALAFAAGMFFIGESDFSIGYAAASLVSEPALASVDSYMGLTSVIGTHQLIYCGVLFVFILSLLFSYYLNPTLRVIQPAYALANSVNEVGFRFFYTVCNVYIVFLFVIAGAFFSQVFNPESVLMSVALSSTDLMIKMGIVCAAMCLILFPLLFMMFTKFKRNPFPVIWSAFITSLVSVFSGNLLFSIPVMEEIHRHQNNSLKRTTVVSGNFMYLFSRVGSASIAYLAITSLANLSGISASTILTQLIVLGMCFGLSLLAGMFPGFEYLFIIVMIRVIMPELVSDNSIALAVAYVPVLSLLGLFIDTFAINFGCKACDVPIRQPNESN